MSFERYRKDVERLSSDAELLKMAMWVEQSPENAKRLKPETLAKLNKFSDGYQTWYSEALACISQLLPERLEDFRSYYTPPKNRKEFTAENYTISDCLNGMTVSRGGEKVVGPEAAIPKFQQQINILKSLERRFESSLFDIRALVQADLFDDELDVADELNKKGFHRGAGAVAGVVLEGHLRTIGSQHKLTVPKNATLGTLNDLLKQANVTDIPTWRFIQHLTDLRNLCDHKLPTDPTKTNIEELIAGVRKVTKTVF